MKTSLLAAAVILPLFYQNVNAQSGCTDPQANNYNAAATINNGSCTYNTTNLALTLKANLATPDLDENSGIEFMPNGLWTFNDSGNPNNIFRVDSATGAVLQTVAISNATNVDWEDITSNNDYLYIGDFGNNNGDRHDLKIYRILKSSLSSVITTVTADIINFSFSDQTTFTTLPNNNNFDCESMIFYNDSIHIFSKDWVDKQSRHYVLEATPGTHSAQYRETLNAGYLVTGASIQNGGVISLVGYDNTGIGPVSMFMLFDYKDGLFFNGNKRKFSLASAINNGQVEGVSFKNSAYGYISNERFIQSIFNVAPKIQSFNLSTYLPATFVNPKPTTAFMVNDSIICKNETVTFTDKSKANPTSFKWTFTSGTPSTSTLQNPTVTYATGGTFAVKLVTTNSGGSDSITKTGYIKVFTLPTSVITMNGPTDLCPGDSTELDANTGGNFVYKWFKNGNVIANATKFKLKVKVAGTYKVQITNANGCSKISAVQKITTLCSPDRHAKNNLDAEIYPNPSTEQFTLNISNSNAQMVHVVITDITGREVKSKLINADEEFVFGNELKPGLYFITLNDNGNRQTFKILKTGL